VNLCNFHTGNPIIFTGFQHINNICKEIHLPGSPKKMTDKEIFGRIYMNFECNFLRRIKSGLYLQPFQSDSGRLAQCRSALRNEHPRKNKSNFVFSGLVQATASD